MSEKPLCIDLFCGLGGWTEGFLAEGWNVVGFDIERHVYGQHQYPAQLVLQDVRTIHGSQFRHAHAIVASSPCQAYSYMAMPWTRARQIAAGLRGEGSFPDGYSGARTLAELNELFEQPARIQREASEAAGRYIPMIQENVKGAQPWVGPARWHFGSFYLWGDVPALMPFTHRARKLGGGASWYPPSDPRHQPGLDFTRLAGLKTLGHVNKRDGHSHTRHLTNQAESDAIKHGGSWFHDPTSPSRQGGVGRGGSKSPARKAASAAIAKIPLPLASHIARVYRGGAS